MMIYDRRGFLIKFNNTYFSGLLYNPFAGLRLFFQINNHIVIKGTHLVQLNLYTVHQLRVCVISDICGIFADFVECL